MEYLCRIKTMKLQTLTKTLTIGLIGVGAALTLQSPSQAADDPLFICGRDSRGIPTTYYIGEGDTRPIIYWKREIFSDAGYPPQLRCEQVTGRFNRLSEREPNGIEIITTGFLNGLPVVYSPASGRDRPSSSNLLFTLSKGEDAVRVVQGLFDLRAGRTVSGSNPKPLSESSADGKTITIDFQNFLRNVAPENSPSSGSSAGETPATTTQPNQSPSGGSRW
jgi:hypothetical protein